MKREVPSLQKLCLVYFSKKMRPSMFTVQALKRADAIVQTNIASPKVQKLKQELVKMLIKSGRFNDSTIPSLDEAATTFFHPTLAKLEIIGSKISIDFVKTHLTPHLTSLTHINLSGSFRLTDAAITVLLTCCSSTLKDMGLENCRKLTDETLVNLCSVVPKLTGFDVGGNFNMTVQGIMNVITTHENHAKFSKVHVAGHALTDEHVKTLYQKCRKLHSVSLGYCDHVSDDALIGMLGKRKSISRLNVHWNTAITDTFLSYIGSNCPNLTDINLCGVSSVSKEGLMNLIHQRMNPPSVVVPSNTDDEPIAEDDKPLKKFKKIDLKYTLFTKDVVTETRTLYPDLTLIV